MLECRFKGWCRIEFDTDFDVCYPCVGDGAETCIEYEPMPEVVRCRDCAHAHEFDDADEGYAEYAGKLDCRHFAQWDYYDDVPGSWPVEPDGFCSWGERRAKEES